MLRHDVTLAHQDDPIVIEVAAGATVTGSIKPPEFLKPIRDMAAKNPSPSQPGMLLRRGRETIPVNSSRPIAISEDGSFEISDVPPGTWQLTLLYIQVRRSVTMMSPIPIQELRGLESGESRHVDLDLSHLMFATFEGTIYIGDKPAPNTALDLKSGDDGFNVFSDRNGRFRHQIRPAHYRATLRATRSGIALGLPADESVDIQPGQKVTQDVHGHTRVVTLRTLGADGKIREGVRLWVSLKSGRVPWSDGYAPTDTSGERSARLPPVKLTVWASPKGKDDRKALVEVMDYDLHQGDGPCLIEVELPASLGY